MEENDKQLEALVGAENCRYLSHEFIRNFLQITKVASPETSPFEENENVNPLESDADQLVTVVEIVEPNDVPIETLNGDESDMASVDQADSEISVDAQSDAANETLNENQSDLSNGSQVDAEKNVDAHNESLDEATSENIDAILNLAPTDCEILDEPPSNEAIESIGINISALEMAAIDQTKDVPSGSNPLKRSRIAERELQRAEGTSKYFSPKPMNAYTLEQARLELDSLLKQRSPTKETSRYQGKKIQLRSTSNQQREELLIENELNDTCSDKSDNGNDSAASNLSTRNKYNRVYNNKAKHAYTTEEDHNILKFLIKTRRYAEIKGNELWKEMAEKNVNFGRSWQSMKERFRKTIATNLQLYVEMYQIDASEIELLQENICYESNAVTTKRVRLNVESIDNDDNVSQSGNDAKVAGNTYSLEEDEGTKLGNCLFLNMSNLITLFYLYHSNYQIHFWTISE